MTSGLALSLSEATKSIHLRRRGGSYLEVTAIIDTIGRQRIFGNERGITGLETAIVLIAFVVVSSVFALDPSPPVSLQVKRPKKRSNRDSTARWEPSKFVESKGRLR